ncbi:MAG: Peptidase hyicolysin, partial [Gemmatimonadetes bacterium]|nr:Peptidase hyicolysin [Gemmatimonadota bacterium]
DIFPQKATTTLFGCPGSNVAEMFYLLAPDPAGTVNGNVRTAGFVDSLTTGVVGHEFQHLINATRRVYVNNAENFEDVWLNEGLSHVAEELLFYRQGGVGPRQNLDAPTIRGSNVVRNAFNTDQIANAGRYREYLLAPSKNSPIRDDDSLATRGATWDFLRYATDRKLRAGGQETAVWQALVNSTTAGVANLRNVFGADIGGMLRDWSVSHYTDDVVTSASVDFTQPSWNWHSIYPALGSGGASYPLVVLPLSATGASGTVIPGAAAFYRFAVPANTLAPIVLSGGTSSSGLAQGTIVRIR